MGPESLEVLIPIVIFGSTAILIGMKMRYSHIKATLLGEGGEEVEQLTETVEDLRAEIGLLRGEFADLNERVDFTERLLERPKTED
jgi:hypothetical protein